MRKTYESEALRIEALVNRRLARLPEHARRLLERFFKKNRLSVHTRNIYVSAVRSYVEVTDAPVADLCNQILTEWYDHSEREGCEPATILLYGVKLRRLYRHALREGGLSKQEAKAKTEELFDVIPFRQLKKEADERNRLRDQLVTPDEFDLMMKAVDHPRVRAFLVMLYESAATVSELTSLRMRDVEFQPRYVQIRVAGRHGERTIPLVKTIPYLRAWIQVHPDRRNPDAPLFIRRYAGRLGALTRRGVDGMFERLNAKAGLKRHIHPHMFRHTRLTELANRDLGEYKMKSFAGWKPDSRMAARYIHLAGKTHLKSVLKIEGVEVAELSVEIEPLIKTRLCPRCDAENEADALYCCRCSMILDDRVLLAKESRMEEGGALAEMLTKDPMVVEALRKAIRRMLVEGGLAK